MLRITKTENGMVRGLPGTDARITVFKGIPYAADTSGKNRWRAPQPAENWEGIRDCFEFSAIPYQAVPGEDPEAFYSKEWHVDPDLPMSEDCLALNIWTPAKSADEKLPVMIWIHGGGMHEGYSYEMEFDGERIASRGAILVSVGYRLNVLGMLAHPDLRKENPDAPSNFNLLDQAYAMAWVKRNIANFGGDPDRVTIFGQSGGGHGVRFHVCSPKAKGLFHRAIIQSACRADLPLSMPDVLPPTRPIAEAEAIGVEFLEKHLGVKTIEEARALPAQFVVDKYYASGIKFMPCIEGLYVTDEPGKNIINDNVNDVDLMVGNTSDDFYAWPFKPVEEWIKGAFGPNADEYLKIVRSIARCDDQDELLRAADFSLFGLGGRVMAETFAKNGRDPYYYTFCPYVPGDGAKVFHSCDLWFCFETLMKCWRPFDGHHYDLARKMCNYWVNFAKTGDPNGLDADGTPMPRWDKYTADHRHGMILGDEIYMETVTDKKLRFLLDVAELR